MSTEIYHPGLCENVDMAEIDTITFVGEGDWKVLFCDGDSFLLSEILCSYRAPAKQYKRHFNERGEPMEPEMAYDSRYNKIDRRKGLELRLAVRSRDNDIQIARTMFLVDEDNLWIFDDRKGERRTESITEAATDE